MPTSPQPIYQRGKYWLAADARADGSLRSPNLTVFWYDPATRRTRSRSTGTAASAEAIAFLDRLYLADGDACPTCGQPFPSRLAKREAVYLLNDAIADYRLEHADTLASADAIAGRLKGVTDFLEATGRLGASADGADELVPELRRWLTAKRVQVRGPGGAVVSTRPRRPASVEDAVSQLRAVLNHAWKRKRIAEQPRVSILPRASLSRPRLWRAGVEELAALLRWAADPREPRRRPYHAWLIGAICTAARKQHVLAINVLPAHEMWQRDLLSLLPAGLQQTKKFRPVVPVPPLLARWLGEVRDDPRTNGWLVQYGGEPMADVKKAHKAAREALGMPLTPECGPSIIRHSMATLMRDRGGTQWDVGGQLGHRPAGTTELYARSTLYVTAQAAIASIISDLETVCPSALHRNKAGPTLRARS